MSGVELPEELAKELDSAFQPVVSKPEPFKITLDPSRVADLQKESQEVSSMLATEDDNKEKPLLTDLAEVRNLWTVLTAWNVKSSQVLLRET